LIEGAQEQVGDFAWTSIVNSWEWGLLKKWEQRGSDKKDRNLLVDWVFCWAVVSLTRSLTTVTMQKGTFHYCVHSCSPQIKWKHNQHRIDKWHNIKFSWGTKKRPASHWITTSWTILFRWTSWSFVFWDPKLRIDDMFCKW
jgi:hypothetical protein